MNLTIIAYVEAGIIVILLLLIIFRKIGRPLSEVEARYKINQRKQKENAKQTKKLEAKRKLKDHWDKLEQQEDLISKMKTPIIIVSASGDILKGYSLCVKDGNDIISNLSAESYEIDYLPRFKGLFNALGTSPGSWKRGMVIVP